MNQQNGYSVSSLLEKKSDIKEERGEWSDERNKAKLSWYIG